VMATYDYSKFNNAFTSTLVDNPQNSVASFSAGTNTGRASLAPNNAAQTGTVTGAVNLPLHTRVMGTGSVSVMTQNDAFLPQALNDSLRRDPNYGLVGTLPRASLDGRVKTTMVNFSATSRPINNLSLAAKYRNYDRTDETAPFHLLAMVVSDRTVTPADSETRETDPFTKSNTDLRAAYQLMPALSLTAGYSWENWKRNADVRNDVGETKEKGPRVSLDYSGIEWLTLHGSYATGERRGNGYLISGTEITDFRRFDLADRDRKQTNILATVTPIDQVNVSFNYQLGDDKFPNSLYGTQSDKSESKGVDVDWTPISRVSVSGGYSRDDATNVLKSRYRTGAAGSVTDNNLSYVWINTNTDKNTTTYASINAVLGRFGQPPFDAVAQLFDVAEDTLLGFPELDHYADRGPARYWGNLPDAGVGDAPAWPKLQGKRIFGYLRTATRHHEAALAALHALGESTVVFFPDAPPALIERYAAPHLVFSATPLDLAQTARERQGRS